MKNCIEILTDSIAGSLLNRRAAFAAITILVLPVIALAQNTITIKVSIENLAPEAGTHLTPFWLGFHDGTFDVFTDGETAPESLESLAEDGNTGPLMGDFDAASGGNRQATVTGPGDPPVFFPEDARSMNFELDRKSANSRYFSFASMVIPSNDAFVGNSDPEAYAIFDEEGNFLPMRITVWGNQVWDAATEVNDEAPENTAFFGQAAANTGVDENSTVILHSGFMAAGEGGILDDASFSGADFTGDGYRIARLTITQVPSNPINVEVTIENLAPDLGTHMTPVWFGFHDGTFDLFNLDESASESLESLAEDGDSGLLAGDFAASASGRVDTTLAGPGAPPVFFPGDLSTMRFTLDGTSSINRYFSYATMIIPSNDAFVGNGDPMAIEIFDSDGNFVGADIIVMGDQVWDTGTELNTETAEHTAFLGQMMPDTGDVETASVGLHPGFNTGGNILMDARFSGADFTTDGYEILRISVVEATRDRRNVKVEVDNLAPESGNFLTPAWVGFHDGGFDVFDVDVSAADFPGLESQAEDGATAGVGERFLDSSSGHVHGTIISNGAIPPYAPSDSGSMTFSLDATSPSSRYLSYSSMVIPSNDAFVANDDPHTLEVFDSTGNFLGIDVVIPGSEVWDAGTEVNDELPANTAFFGQAAPNTGVDENGTVAAHAGFNALGTGGILDDEMFSGADFLAPDYDILRLRVSEVPAKRVGIDVTIENLAPESGTFLTPVWVGIHNGGFDLFNEGETASLGLQSLSEDGATDLIGNEFLVSQAGIVHATVTSGGSIPPFAPGQSNTFTFALDGASPDNRYLSYASMVIPSNDAFVANGDPLAVPIFDESGDLIESETIVIGGGGTVWDAGTEVNDELPANTAFFGQAAADTGVDQNGTVAPHIGFMASGAGGILDDAMFSGADFTATGYQVLRINISQSDNPWGDLLFIGGSEFKFSEWFGLIYDPIYPWVFHPDHGWSYVIAEAGEPGILLFNDLDSLGWLYTSADLYPFVYSFDLGAWLYYFEGSSNPRQFFNFDPTINDWIVIPGQ